MRRDRMRAGERGLSLIEALIIVTITAMLALLLLPLASRAAGRSFALADRALDVAGAANAEAQFRALAGANTVRDGIIGRPDAIVLSPSIATDVACARAGGPQRVRLSIETGRLVCEGESGRHVLTQWREGQARFSFSADGRAWTDQHRGAPGYVRFELVRRGRSEIAWVGLLGPAPAEAPP